MSEDESVENQKEPENTETEEAEPLKKKYEFIEDLPGVGPATAQKLRELGYHTVESLAMATARTRPRGSKRKKGFPNNTGGSFIHRHRLRPSRRTLQNARKRFTIKHRQQSLRQNS